MSMRHAARLAACCLAAAFSVSAFAASTVNPNQPAQNSPMASAPIRSNFLATYNDVNNLLSDFAGAAAPSSPSLFQRWMNTSAIPYQLMVFDGNQWVLSGQLNVSTHTWSNAGTYSGAPIGTAYGGLGANFGSATGALSINAGTVSAGTLPPAFLPTPTGSTLGGIESIGSTSHRWIAYIDGSGVPHQSQPAFSDVSGAAITSQLPAGKSVADPGTGVLEGLLPLQTVSGTSKAFATADLQLETRRSNSGTAMTDTFPASTAQGLANGAQITLNNVDATATDTITAGAGTTINSGSTDAVGPGRSIRYVYDLASTTWRRTLNTGSALLGPNNLSDLSSASTARTNLGLGSLATLSAVNNGNWSGTALAVSNGGTGATAAGATAANNIGALASASNLSDLANSTTARTNLGLGSLAMLNSVNNANWSGTVLAVANGGTGASAAGATAAANIGALAKANNLSDVASASSSRTNLGLGSLAMLNQTIGAWTPADASGASLTFTSVSAAYTQIGNMVFAYASFAYPSTASGANAVISGLPVATLTAAYQLQCHLNISPSASVTYVAPAASSTQVIFYTPTGTNATNSQLSGGHVIIECIYPAT